MNQKKVTHGYINTEIKITDLITFQIFQKLFIENDMTWRNKNNKFIPSELEQEAIELDK